MSEENSPIVDNVVRLQTTMKIKVRKEGKEVDKELIIKELCGNEVITVSKNAFQLYQSVITETFDFELIRDLCKDLIPSAVVGMSKEEFLYCGLSFYKKFWDKFKEVNKDFLLMLESSGVMKDGKLNLSPQFIEEEIEEEPVKN